MGLVALEMFVTRDGSVLANEMAPRPHNSGHWTIDACATSQFEQLVRAICGLPLGAVDVLAPSRMENLIGEEADDWPRFVADPTARLHLYGKAEARPGRKMGHVTYVGNWASCRPSLGPRHAPNSRFPLLEAHDVVDTPVEEAPGCLAALGTVVQPVEKCRAVDARQGRPLGVEIEIGAGVAGGVPDGVDRPVEQLQPQGRIGRQASMASPRRTDSRPPTVCSIRARTAVLIRSRILMATPGRLHCLDGARSARSDSQARTVDRSAREQPLGLAVRGADMAGGGPDRDSAPAAEGSFVRHRLGQLAAQGGVGIEIRAIGSVHQGTISLQPGLPKAGGL